MTRAERKVLNLYMERAATFRTVLLDQWMAARDSLGDYPDNERAKWKIEFLHDILREDEIKLRQISEAVRELGMPICDFEEETIG
ncbi:MAG TPA: hypothetical protein VF077_00470 [Nitrospiraceae bacterium]